MSFSIHHLYACPAFSPNIISFTGIWFYLSHWVSKIFIACQLLLFLSLAPFIIVNIEDYGDSSVSALGSRLSIKIPSYRYKDSHYKDKAVWQPSNLYNGIPYTRKDSLYIETGLRMLANIVQEWGEERANSWFSWRKNLGKWHLWWTVVKYTAKPLRLCIKLIPTLRIKQNKYFYLHKVYVTYIISLHLREAMIHCQL